MNLDEMLSQQAGPVREPTAEVRPMSDDKRRILQLLGLQQEGVNQSNELANMAQGREMDVDISPLLALADSYSGGKSKYLSGYTKPETASERTNQIAALRKVANDDQAAVTKNLLGSEDTQTRLMKALAGAAGRSPGELSEKGDFAALNYVKDFNKGEQLKKLKMQSADLDIVDTLIDLAQSGDQVALSAAGIKLAKAMGEVGVLTEQDVTRYINAKSLSRRLADKLMTWKSGKVTDATASDIKRMSAVMKGMMRDKYAPIYETGAKQLSKNLHMDTEDAHNRLATPDWVLNPKVDPLNSKPSWVDPKDWEKASGDQREAFIDADEQGFRPPGKK